MLWRTFLSLTLEPPISFSFLLLLSIFAFLCLEIPLTLVPLVWPPGSTHSGIVTLSKRCRGMVRQLENGDNGVQAAQTRFIQYLKVLVSCIHMIPWLVGAAECQQMQLQWICPSHALFQHDLSLCGDTTVSCAIGCHRVQSYGTSTPNCMAGIISLLELGFHPV